MRIKELSLSYREGYRDIKLKLSASQSTFTVMLTTVTAVGRSDRKSPIILIYSCYIYFAKFTRLLIDNI